MVAGAILINGEMFQNFTLHFGEDASLQCNAPGVQALASSWITCFLFRLPFYLESIQLNCITFGLNILVIMISMFGGLQDNCYKYIFMAQSLWDIFVAYDFTCYKPTLEYFRFSNPKMAEKLWNHGPATCLYTTEDSDEPSSSMEFLFTCCMLILRYVPFYHVLIFAFAFVKSMFCPMPSSGIKTCINIFTANIISLAIVCLIPINSIIRHLMASCKFEKSSLCFSHYLNFYDKYGTIIPLVFSLCCLSLSFILVITVAIKLFRNFKNNNASTVSTSSIQILSVLIIQFFMATLCFSFIYLHDYRNLWAGSGKIYFVISCLIVCLNMLRSFVNSIAILTVISGYRNAIIDLFVSLKMGVIYFAKTLIFDDYPSPQRRSATIHCSNDSNDSDYEFDSVHVRYIPIDHV